MFNFIPWPSFESFHVAFKFSNILNQAFNYLGKECDNDNFFYKLIFFIKNPSGVSAVVLSYV